MQIDLKDFNFLISSIQYISSLFEQTCEYQNHRISLFEKLHEEANKELNLSQNLLSAAKALEAQKLVFLMQEEAEFAQAMSEEAAAIASGNPAAIAAASAYVAQKLSDVAHAKNEYEKAKQNRFNMEKRVELTQKAAHESLQMLESSKAFFASQNAFLNSLKEQITFKLTNAYKAITDYYTNASYVESLDIIKPDNLKQMLSLDQEKTKKYFDFFYATDEKFKKQVDKLKEEYKNAKTDFEREKVILKIRQNLAGAYAEKFIQTSFSSIGKVHTQHTQEMGESFSKVDILITDIKKPLILGRGKCKHLKKGSTLAIEIKTGSKEYLRSQKEHLKFQTDAHKKTADMSVIITSKDIYDLKDEEEFREIFKQECSHIIAMLPRKSEIDQYIINSMELK